MALSGAWRGILLKYLFNLLSLNGVFIGVVPLITSHSCVSRWMSRFLSWSPLLDVQGLFSVLPYFLVFSLFPFWSCMSLSPGRLCWMNWVSLPAYIFTCLSPFVLCPSVSCGYVSILVVLFESFTPFPHPM